MNRYVIYLLICLTIVSALYYACLTKVLSSTVVRHRGRYFCLNVVVDKQLCYLFDDMLDHFERPLVGWPH